MDNVVPARRLPLAPLRPPKASEFFAQRLRTAILLGELSQGDVLPPEKDLVAQLGISRATVREGLRLLEAEGLITTRPGRGGGAMVRRPSHSAHTRSLALLLQFDGTTLGELLETRRVVEPICARLAAERAGPEEIALLRATLDELTHLTDNRAAYLAAQVRFHLGIVRAAHNTVLRIYATSLAELTFEQIRQVPFTADDLAAGAQAGAAILAALEQRDSAAAERRTARHLAAIEAAIARLGWPMDQPTVELATLAGDAR